MKKLIALFLAALLVYCLAACADSGSSAGNPGKPDETAAPAGPAVLEKLPTVLSQTEYVLYQNFFYGDGAGDYIGKTVTKEGTFTRLYDAFSQKTRYYVWGYMDATKCCDWQWEFVPAQGAELPAVGSQVEVTGDFAGSENALDGYWIEDAAIQVRTPYAAPATDIALTTMSDTLERVQLLNIQYKPEEFEGKDVYFYGRVSGPGVIEDPYYDGSWTQNIESADELPAIGTIVIVHGTVKNGVVTAATLTPTEEY